MKRSKCNESVLEHRAIAMSHLAGFSALLTRIPAPCFIQALRNDAEILGGNDLKEKGLHIRPLLCLLCHLRI
jgi:hypothetical protein